jgi:hypothetical protein
MLNYEVDPSVLQGFVPRGTELDAWAGKHFVSMVGFQFLDTKVLGLPIPFHRNFEEVNLRFYVRREVDGEVRRGVVFIKEIVPRAAIAWLARALYNENYVALPMSHEDGLDAEPRRVSYDWSLGETPCRLAVSPVGEASIPREGSEETFITEHYWGYVRQRDGSTVEYRVEHPQWPVWQGTAAVFECDVATLYGPELVPFLQGVLSSAFLAEGSAVTVSRGCKLAT